MLAEQHHSGQPVEHEPPPAFSDSYGKVDFNQDGFGTKARVANDGRVNIKIHQQSRKLSDLLVPALRSQLDLHKDVESAVPLAEHARPIVGGVPDQAPSPPLNVVIHVVGSRGDVQPFISLGKVLQKRYGHRIRLATHPTFRSFVEDNGLEFFSIGGDPAELMAFMVKNPGLMPGMDSLRSGDVGKRRKGMFEIVQGCWRSCIEIGDGTGTLGSDDHLEGLHNLIRSTEHGPAPVAVPSVKPFVADAIIANPPSFAGVHCAEKLGIPLHLMFTMPWSPTQAFPHPLANIQSSNADQSITNFVSYALVEMMTWQGLGDIINRFREKSLGLEPVSLMWAPGMASRLRIPYTYCWSPTLIPKPKDWGSHISVAGFYFLSLASHFNPDPELASFLDDGPPPVYIGFGSIVVDDPNAMTRLIFDAVKQSGQRALVSKGWGGLGSDDVEVPGDIFMLGNVPHDWLFGHVSCVVHHGGAGTTAAGIAAGKPTVVVPFFGDQPFWGSMVAKAGAGPRPIPHKQLTSENLAAAILDALHPEALQKAQKLGSSISKESGADRGAEDFQEKLDIDSLRCSVAPNRAAAWRVKRTNIRLSSFAAAVLREEGLLDFNNLKLYRPREYDAEDGPWDPITGATSAIMGTMGSMMMGVADLPIEILKALHIKPPQHPTTYSSLQTASPTSTSDANSDIQKSSMAVTADVDDDTSLPASPRSSFTSRSTTAGAQKSMPISSQNLVEEIPNASWESSNASRQQSAGSTLDPSRGQSMAHALSDSASIPSSRGRSSFDASTNRSSSESQPGTISLDAAVGAGKGIGRIVSAGLKSPMDFTLSLARGFHNAPKLYGDDMVRHPDKVTGIRTGLKAAGKEFGYGMYDGVSGIFTQPIHGAKQEGVGGFIKGVGKGIGGFLLKPQAAFFSLPAYTMSGIYKELQKQFGSSVQSYIVAARTAQGYEELASSSREDRLDVVKRWQAAQLELHKEKQQLKDNAAHPSDCVFLRAKHAAHSTLAEKRKYARDGKLHKVPNHARHGSSAHMKGATASDIPTHLATGYHLGSADSVTFEHAIQQSVEATSRGDHQEDAMIERAIRASVTELRVNSDEAGKDEAIQRAIRASVREAAQARTAIAASGGDSGIPISDDDLHLALQRSLSLHGTVEDRKNQHLDGPGADADDARDLKTAHAQSHAAQVQSNATDIILQKAIEQSRLAHDRHVEGLEKERTEEEIVLEYVKKQSLLEEECRRSVSSRAAIPGIADKL
ncbi:MAG: hypothetical protein Q9170_005452 [Blastenia crenularia]